MGVLMQSVFSAINSIFSFIGPLSDFLWEFPTNLAWYRNIPVLGSFSFAIILLMGSGVYFSFKLGFIQVTYFKKTGGKRIFRMAPIHHHFELGGWSETRVVAVFSITTALLCLVGLMAL